MVPPSQTLSFDLAAVSGICGSISIACWVVVFSPQIVENFRRQSADGLSLQFIIVWLVGDVFNILGAVLQGVLPTMIILAVYYTLADIVLLGQCFYYRGFTFSDAVPDPIKPLDSSFEAVDEFHEATGLLSPSPLEQGHSRRWSGEHLSPAVPLIIPPSSPELENERMREHRQTSRLTAALFNIFAILMVCVAGVLGWWFSSGSRKQSHYHLKPSAVYGALGINSESDSGSAHDDELVFNLWGQVFGYLCAAFYLLSRMPQILLNYRRKSTEGVSMLFFLFACIGNLTYVLSILAFEPRCLESQIDAGQTAGAASYKAITMMHRCSSTEARRIYARYMAVNASWLLGSAGTLFLDFAIFCQFFYYREHGQDGDEANEVRPLLG